jgi:hypothetical protein
VGADYRAPVWLAICYLNVDVRLNTRSTVFLYSSSFSWLWIDNSTARPLHIPFWAKSVFHLACFPVKLTREQSCRACALAFWLYSLVFTHNCDSTIYRVHDKIINISSI